LGIHEAEHWEGLAPVGLPESHGVVGKALVKPVGTVSTRIVPICAMVTEGLPIGDGKVTVLSTHTRIG
jgi:hypothetical protein